MRREALRADDDDGRTEEGEGQEDRARWYEGECLGVEHPQQQLGQYGDHRNGAEDHIHLGCRDDRLGRQAEEVGAAADEAKGEHQPEAVRGEHHLEHRFDHAEPLVSQPPDDDRGDAGDSEVHEPGQGVDGDGCPVAGDAATLFALGPGQHDVAARDEGEEHDDSRTTDLGYTTSSDHQERTAQRERE